MKKLMFLGLISAFVDCSETAAMRKFESLATGFREKLPFETEKLSISSNALLSDNQYGTQASMVCDSKGLVRFGWNRQEQLPNSELMYTGEEFVLHLYGEEFPNNPDELLDMLDIDALQNLYKDFVSIHDGVEELGRELCDSSPHSWLFRVTFGAGSSLKRIGKEAFSYSIIKEIHIPDGVEELCEDCFRGCTSLSRVILGLGSNLKRIGEGAFSGSSLCEIHIPDSVEELCKKCFFDCGRLHCATFGENSGLKRIGKMAFWHNSMQELHIPDGVEELGNQCFAFCRFLSRVTFGENSSLKRIGKKAFYESGICEIRLPRSVEEIGVGCFRSCYSLFRITFKEDSKLKLIGAAAFYFSGISEVNIPDSLKDLCKDCFSDC